jgi:hypothetical protein
MNMLSLGGLRHHLAKQYIMLGQQTAGQVSQPPVAWKIAR